MLDVVTKGTVIAGARVVLDDSVVEGGLVLDDDRIGEVFAGGASKALDFEGDLLLPGLIDLHTDNLERHFQPRAGVTWDGVAAAIAHDAQIATAGITTVFDSLTIGAAQGWDARAEMVEPMIKGLFEAIDYAMLRVEHRLHLRCEITHPDLLEIFAQHRAQGPVHMVSIMDHAPGDRQSPNLEAYRQRYQKSGMSLEATDAHVQGLIDGSRRHGPKNRDGIAAVAREAGLSLATHDDARPEHVDIALGLGASFTEFPTTLDAARHAKARGLPVMMGSPNLMRGGSHSGNVSAGALLQAGLLDLLASDYIPASLIKAAFKLLQPPFELDLPEAISMVTSKPALVAGLDDRGRIASDLRADFLRVRVVNNRPIVREVWSRGRRVA